MERADGIVGIGEGVSPGGPWWSGEAIETRQAMIEHRFVPFLRGLDQLCLPTIVERLDTVAHGNEFAKAAVEMALFRRPRQRVGVSASTLLGVGPARDRLPVRWAVGAAEVAATAREERERLDLGHGALKLKMGAGGHHRGRRIRRRLPRRPNGAWPLETARWVGDELEHLGVSSVEQPIRRDDLDGLAQLTERATRIAVVADEAVCTPSETLRATRRRTCDAVAVKVGKAGGLLRGYAVGLIAATAGLGCYGDTALESPIGTAARCCDAPKVCTALPKGIGGHWLPRTKLGAIVARHPRTPAHTASAHTAPAHKGDP